MARTAGILAATLALFWAGPAHGAPVSESADSEAPPGAPPHWLPSEEWVMSHWLPFDEDRLYRLAKITRGDVWRSLRDDTRPLADLVEDRGWDPRKLADALVAPRREAVPPELYRELRSRALRVLTQGHLAQHVLFHSLHQNAVPNRAPEIFGTASPEEFRTLRRAEFSPIQICRLNGRSRAETQRKVEQVLRDTASLAVRTGQMTRRQARILLGRQLRQVPRWMQQTRYNGPPPVKQPRPSLATATNYSNNAAISGEGRQIVFENYDTVPASAVLKGEIRVLARGIGQDEPALVSWRPRFDDPRSAYNPAVSGDGRYVAFESAEGNLNFAKRYGAMAVFVRDRVSGRILRAGSLAGRARGAAPRRSEYNATISADGRYVAFESSQAGTQGRPFRIAAYVRDLQTGRVRTVGKIDGPHGADADGDVYEPVIAAGGRHVAFTSLARSLPGGRHAGGRSRVYVRGLESGEIRLASDPGSESYEPSVSSDGSKLAFTSVSRPGAQPRVLVRDLRTGRTVDASQGLTGAAGDASLAGGGTSVAFTLIPRGAQLGRGSQVYLRDLRSGALTLVSRADGPRGEPARGTSARPSISADGSRVAFTSDAWNLDAGKCNGARGIFVRDLKAARTALVSIGDGTTNRSGSWRWPRCAPVQRPSGAFAAISA